MRLGRAAAMLVVLASARQADSFGVMPKTPTAYGVTVSPRGPLTNMAMATVERVENDQWADLHEFNRYLDRLAELSGNPNEAAISRAYECEELWDAQRKDDMNSSIHPDTVSLNTVLKAWSKACASLAADDGGKRRKSSQNASDQSIEVYTTRDTAEHATKILFREESENDDGAKPDITSYNIVIGAWAKSKLEDSPEVTERLLKRVLDHPDLEPDWLTYHGVLDAWAHSSAPNALERTEQVFSHVQKLRDSGSDVKPTAQMVNSLCHAYSRKGRSHVLQRQYKQGFECAEQARRLLDELISRYEDTDDEAYEPDFMTYSTVIDCFSHCGYKGAVEAEKLLSDLEALYARTSNPKHQPNVRTYTSVLAAWSRSRSDDAMRHALKVLERMKASEDAAPNARTYTILIKCWSRSSDNSKALHALKILRDTKEEYKQTKKPDLRPNVFMYNAVIEACGKCQGTVKEQMEALKIIFAVLKSIAMEKGVEPNASTFRLSVDALGTLLPPGEERSKLASQVFEKAKAAGLVDQYIVRSMKAVADADVINEVFGEMEDSNGHIDLQKMPKSWSSNIVGGAF